MPYTAAISEYQFIFDHVVPIKEVAETERFADATPDMVNAILTEGARLSDEVIAPLQRPGDLNPAHLENGVVRTSPGYKEGYQAIADGGWVGIAADPDHGGMGLPQSLACAVDDMMSGACIALQLCPLLSKGQIEALEHHADDWIKELYLPKLNAGTWTGTMNLTEPHAGTDVGALTTKAEPQDDGSYKITGQKIFITWGEHDAAENISHLVLARLPDSVPGPKGITLFIVPKFIPNADGTLGARNDLRCVSLEHKLGIHGSPTAVMEYSGATGWLVGEENNGMACMFTMMNNARLSVAIQGIGVAEAAFQHAAEYAMGRKQGKTPLPDGQGTIIDHADVRRMLSHMKADIFASRAIGAACAKANDMSMATGDAGWAARGALLTPIAKGFGTDVGVAVADLGVQIHGGMGFVEETAAAQFLRDVRITPIYEGTNGIQAMDLVGRKMMDGGVAAFALMDEMQVTADGSADYGPALSAAIASLRDVTNWLIEANIQDRFAGAVTYQRAFARVLGAHFHALAAGAGAAPRKALANFYFNALLPEHVSLLAQAKIGASDLYAMTAEELVA